MKSILIFGGGDNQKTLIQNAKDLGYKTIVIDPNSLAPAKNLADIFEVVDGKDYSRTKEIALKNQVSGIITCQMENPLILMSELASELNFLFPKRESIIMARDKFLMKKAFLKNGVPCANGQLVNNINEIGKKPISFPSILKPIDAFSSRGVYKVNSFEEIADRFADSQRFSTNGTVILEEFIDGREFSIESITNNGITEIIQITEKEITPYPNTVEISHIQPANISDIEKNQIEHLVKKAIKALDLDFCATHTELKLSSKGPVMIEIGARLGGDYITSHLVPLSTGISIEKLAIQIAMGDFDSVPNHKAAAAAIRYLSLPSGRQVTAVEDFSVLFNDPDLIHALVFLKTGDITQAITDSAKRPGFVIVSGKNHLEIKEKSQTLANKLSSFIKFE